MAVGVITIPAFSSEREGARHFFGTRLASAPARGWAGGRDGEPAIVSVRQVHGTDVLVLDRPVARGETFEGGWDALVTDRSRVMVTVRTADCVPLLLHNPSRGVVAAVHAGWRGALAGIVPRTIATMAERFGSAPSSVRVAIGPSAGPCCYEVDEPVLARLRGAVPDWQTVVRAPRPGRALLDLRLLVRLQAEAAGVPADSIQAVNLCTICRPELFHSYRRDGEVRGTMVSGIMLTGRRAARGRSGRAGRARPVNRRGLPVQ